MNSRMVTACIIDDEQLARKAIEQLLLEIDYVDILDSLGDPVEALDVISEKKPDIIFLDIQMPELNGFQFLEELETPWPLIIFTTAYDEFALEAFRVHAIDYLLKPIDDERFYEALERACKLIQQEDTDWIQTRIKSLLSHMENRAANGSYRTRIPIKKSDKIFFIQDNDIIWIKASGKYVEVKNNGKKHLLRSLLSEFGESLNPDKFIRIHRSVIINIDQITQINPWFRGEYQVVMSDGETFTTGKKYRHLLTDLID